VNLETLVRVFRVGSCAWDPLSGIFRLGLFAWDTYAYDLLSFFPFGSHLGCLAGDRWIGTVSLGTLGLEL